MADQTIYKLTEDVQMPQHPFTRKTLTWIQDQSASGQYQGGQVLFNNASIAASGLWASYREAYLAIPYTLSMSSTTDISGATQSPYMAGLKSGFWHLIDSITVDYNGKNVVQSTQFTNVWASFKAMTSWSQDSLNKYGPSFGFFPDTENSFVYSAAVGLNGIGYTNNRNFAANIAFTDELYTAPPYNSGFLTRQQRSGFTGGAYLAGGAALLPYASAANLGEHTFAAFGAGVARAWYWSGIAKIRLADLSDFFEKMPICKGAAFTMTINLNISTATCAVVTSTSIGATMTNSRNTCPFMISSAAANNALASTVGVAADPPLVFRLTIGQSPNSNVTQAFTAVRLYVPQYEMDPMYAAQYLELNKTRTVVYRDIQLVTALNIANNAQISTLLNNGISNPKRVIVVPFINAASNGAAGFSEYQGPFSSAPATTSPLATIQYFQVQLASKNMFQTQQQYDFDTFQSELSKTGLNGGQTIKLGSGLISEQMFQYAYRYYVCDLSREPPSSIPQSVQVLGTNVTGTPIDLICFIEYEKTLHFDTLTGAVLD